MFKYEGDRDIIRFWSYVEKRHRDTCWLWQGSKNPTPNGFVYGQHQFRKKMQSAHRIAFSITYGFWPAVVRHACDTPLCCNPRHLRAGTQKDNMRDCVERGRICRGSQHPFAKIDEQKAAFIKTSPLKAKHLAASLGVGLSTIYDVRSGRSWVHA